MKTRIFGGLCFVSFLISSLAYLPGQGTVLETKDSTSSTVDHQAVRSNQASFRGAQEKASKMVAVTASWCEPCRRLKKNTLPVLVSEGYRITDVDYQSWKGPKVRSVPTLFYMDDQGNIMFKEVGFRTPKQIKKYLRK